jgi:hypothetical protein
MMMGRDETQNGLVWAKGNHLRLDALSLALAEILLIIFG